MSFSVLAKRVSVMLALGALFAAGVLVLAGCGEDKPEPEPDTTAPVVVRTEPEDGASGVARDVTIQLWFDEAVDNSRGGWDDRLHLRRSDGTNLYGNGSYDLKQYIATLNMSMELMPGETYTAVLEKGVCDMAGNCMADGLTWTFTIAQ